MDENTVGRIDGTNVISSTSPITYEALKAYGAAVDRLNAQEEITPADLGGHFDRAIRDVYATLAEIEMRTKFNVIDET